MKPTIYKTVVTFDSGEVQINFWREQWKALLFISEQKTRGNTVELIKEPA